MKYIVVARSPVAQKVDKENLHRKNAAQEEEKKKKRRNWPKSINMNGEETGRETKPKGVNRPVGMKGRGETNQA